jgi:hypothetical protein
MAKKKYILNFESSMHVDQQAVKPSSLRSVVHLIVR